MPKKPKMQIRCRISSMYDLRYRMDLCILL